MTKNTILDPCNAQSPPILVMQLQMWSGFKVLRLILKPSSPLWMSLWIEKSRVGPDFPPLL